MPKKVVLVLGASGMLGNAMLRYFLDRGMFKTFGTVRTNRAINLFATKIRPHVISGIDVEDFDCLLNLFGRVNPDIVVNCIGLVKQLSAAEDPLSALPINALLPHRLAKLCELSGARLIHMSTDCVFSGSKGLYTEEDIPDARDLYGISKCLGEVDYHNAITLRTSIIGHELEGAHSLIGWFLSQRENVQGYKKAIFSGLPTVEIAQIIHDLVIPRPYLHGVYHVSAEPINKYDLLKLVADIYKKDIDIAPYEAISINRSLDSSRFSEETGYKPKPWGDLIERMYQFG